MEVLFFAIRPFQCIGLFCARKVLGLSVARNMGQSVPSKVSNSLCLFNMFLKLQLRDNPCPLPPNSGLSVPSINGAAR